MTYLSENLNNLICQYNYVVQLVYYPKLNLTIHPINYRLVRGAQATSFHKGRLILSFLLYHTRGAIFSVIIACFLLLDF